MVNQRKIQDLAILAVAVTLIQVVLSRFIYPAFGAGTVELFSIDPISVSSGAVGGKILGFISGITPFSFSDSTSFIVVLLTALITTFLLLLAGYWIYERKFVWKGKNIYQRLAAIILYGTFVLYVFVLLTSGGIINLSAQVLLGLFINYAAIVAIVAFVSKKFRILRV